MGRPLEDGRHLGHFQLTGGMTLRQARQAYQKNKERMMKDRAAEMRALGKDLDDQDDDE